MKKERIRTKVSKFTIVISVLVVVVVALVCAIASVYIDILRIRAQLDNFYWIAENTHSGGVRIAIDELEARLHQKVTVLTVLAVVATLIIASLILIKTSQGWMLRRRFTA